MNWRRDWCGGSTAMAVVLGIALAVAPAMAVDTATWELGGPLDFIHTETEHVSITARGDAILAPELELVFDPGQSYIWALAPAEDGSVVAGTGDSGLIARIPRRGQGEILHDSIELQILSVAVGRDGAVYAGGAPDGAIIRFKDGRAETFCDLPESYIWALAFAPDGDLFAATGDRGRLYRVNGQGEASVYYDSDEVHLLCLLPAMTGKAWLVGTSGSGLVLEITAQDEGRVLYDAREEEIKALTWDAQANLLIAATGSEGPAVAALPPSADVIEVRPAQAGAHGTNEQNRDRSASPPPGRGVIYKRTPAGAVTQFWRAPDNIVLAIEADGKGNILAATGDRGAIYELDPRGNASRLVQTEESQVLCLERTPDGILVGTANPGRVYRLGPEVEASGTMTVEPFDAGNVAAWGRLRFVAEEPPGTAIEVRTRTGNTEGPDDTWSDWSPPLTAPAGTLIQSPPARFIQWQATLKGNKTRSPRLDQVVVAYLQQNLPPRIQVIEVTEPSDKMMPQLMDGSPDRIAVNMEGGVRAEFARSRQAPSALRRDQVPWLRDIKVANWVADDPNGDRLDFSLFVRGEGETRWRPLAEDVPDQTHPFSTAGLPDGEYRLKVIASDRRSNPDASALTDSLDSSSFVVDNTPPQITKLRVERAAEDRLVVNATVVDELSVIRAFEYSVDARSWEPAFPLDGIFDALEESFRVEIDLAREAARARAAGYEFLRDPGSGPAAETVFVRAADTAGNLGAARSVAP